MTGHVQSRPTAPSTVRPSPRRTHEVDIAIIGAGLSGSLAAAVLGRAGYRVALIDRYRAYPPEFRVEKVGGDQVELLRRLGLLDCVAAASTPFNQVINARHGQVIDRTNTPHYGIFYQDFVNVVRAQLPSSVKFVVGQAVDVKADAERPQVVFADDIAVDARLVVLATGMAATLRHKLGLVRKNIAEKHSISFGFNIAPAPGATFDFPALTYYGEQVSDCIDYLSLFPIGEVMRANLFTFRDHRDPWVRDLRQRAGRHIDRDHARSATISRRFRGCRQSSELDDGSLRSRKLSARRCRAHRRCVPDLVPGCWNGRHSAADRCASAVQRACSAMVCERRHRSSRKIAQFYADPVKQRADGRSLRLAHYRRSLTIDDSLRWKAHRGRAYLRRRVLGWVKELKLVRAAYTPVARALVRGG